FRNPTPDNKGFAWSDIDPKWKFWNPVLFRAKLMHPLAERGFKIDMDSLRWCEACVLVMPCGRSAHLEIGWAAGAGKKTAILLDSGEPELMYKIVDKIAITTDEIIDWVRSLELAPISRRPR
ncbi:hypothetical protein LCGC14_2920000, partial [marine sediment metagenome]